MHARSIMQGMSFGDTVVIFVLALLFFGPKKLPELARQIGKVLNEFKRASNEFRSQIESEVSQLEVKERAQAFATPSAPPEGSVIAHSPRAELSVGPQPAVEETPLETPTLEPTREAIQEPAHRIEAETAIAKAPDA
jgi:sec-independent protein translocase protein TatB